MSLGMALYHHEYNATGVPAASAAGPGGSSTKPSVPISEVKSPDPRVGLGTACRCACCEGDLHGDEQRQRRFHLEALRQRDRLRRPGRGAQRRLAAPRTRSAPGTPASTPGCQAGRTPSDRLLLRRTTAACRAAARPCERPRARPAPPAPAGCSRIAPSKRRRSGSARRVPRGAQRRRVRRIAGSSGR